LAYLLYAGLPTSSNESLVGTKREARQLLEDTIKLQSEAGDRLTEARVHLVAASLQEDRATAVEHFRKALAILATIKTSPGAMDATVQTVQNSLSAFEDPEEKKRTIQQAIEILRLNQNRIGEAQFLSSVGYSYVSDLDRASEYLLKAKSVYAELNNRFREGTILGSIGWASKTPNKAKAIDYFSQALVIFQSLKSKQEQITTLRELSSLYEATGDKKKAEETAKLAREIETARAKYFSTVSPGLPTFSMPNPPIR
jgi:tetratricopeptide (TPR) repeat protein